ncbi:hypothetical protein ACFL1M_02055 [Patescibacteria group bacterium]
MTYNEKQMGWLSKLGEKSVEDLLGDLTHTHDRMKQICTDLDIPGRSSLNTKALMAPAIVQALSDMAKDLAPAAEESTAEEPVDEEPVAEEPAAEENTD